jgi:hypothetical protein
MDESQQGSRPESAAPASDDTVGPHAAPTKQKPEPPPFSVLCLAKYKRRTAETHQEHLVYLKASGEQGQAAPEVLLLGDSMVERFTTTGKGYMPAIQHNFKMALAGVGGDGVQHMVYRLHHGLLDSFQGTPSHFGCFQQCRFTNRTTPCVFYCCGGR